MVITYGNLQETKHKYICITTNGFINPKGEAVITSSSGRVMVRAYPELPKLLGNALKKNGNCVNAIKIKDVTIISFPDRGAEGIVCFGKINVTADRRDAYRIGDYLPGFDMRTDMVIIERSIAELKTYLEKNKIQDTVVMPRVGVNTGRYTWMSIIKRLSVLGDNVHTITYRPSEFKAYFYGKDYPLTSCLTCELDELIAWDVELVLSDDTGETNTFMLDYLHSRGYRNITVFKAGDDRRYDGIRYIDVLDTVTSAVDYCTLGVTYYEKENTVLTKEINAIGKRTYFLERKNCAD